MIIKIEFKNIPVSFIKEARRKRISFIKDVQYYGYYDDDKLVAIAGIKNYKKVAKLKSSYVIPEYRNKGIYSELVKHRISVIEQNIIETNALKENSKYLQTIGFQLIRSYQIADLLRYVKTHSNR